MADNFSLDNIKVSPTSGKGKKLAADGTSLQDASLGQATTALGAAMGGASPDQAKMASTPNAKAALGERDTGMQPVQRTAPAKPAPSLTQQKAEELSAEEQAKNDRLENMAKYGQLRVEVQDMVKAASGDLKAVDIAPDDAEIQTAITSLNLTPDQMANMSPEEMAAKVKAKFGDTSAIASKVDAALTASLSKVNAASILQKSGTNLETAAKTLGVSPEQLSGMSVADFQSLVKKQQAAETQNVVNLQASLNDPTISPAKRQAAMEELRRLGASGEVSKVFEVRDLHDQIDSIDDVSFAGQQYGSLQELLSSDSINATIDSYLNGTAKDAGTAGNTLSGITIGTKDDGSPRTLKDLVSENAEQFKKAMTTIDTKASARIQSSKNILAAGTTQGGVSLTASTLKKFIPGAFVNQDDPEAYLNTVKKSNVYKALKGEELPGGGKLNNTESAAFVKAMNDMADAGLLDDHKFVDMIDNLGTKEALMNVVSNYKTHIAHVGVNNAAKEYDKDPSEKNTVNLVASMQKLPGAEALSRFSPEEITRWGKSYGIDMAALTKSVVGAQLGTVESAVFGSIKIDKLPMPPEVLGNAVDIMWADETITPEEMKIMDAFDLGPIMPYFEEVKKRVADRQYRRSPEGVAAQKAIDDAAEAKRIAEENALKEAEASKLAEAQRKHLQGGTMAEVQRELEAGDVLGASGRVIKDTATAASKVGEKVAPVVKKYDEAVGFGAVKKAGKKLFG